MIFVTVGTQLPFDRLVKWIDAWAQLHPSEEVFVQCGAGAWLPQYAKYSTDLPPEQWESYFQQADLVISHAGMGTILKSLDFGKPLVIVPRLAEFKEHRNDHQLATANRFKHISSIYVAENASGLHAALDNPDFLSVTKSASNQNLEQLCQRLRAFVMS